MKRNYIIGSVSSGTMRPEDLIPCFLSIADDIRMSKADRNKVRALSKEWDSVCNQCGITCLNDYGKCIYDCVCHTKDEADTDEILADLFDILGNYAPPYFYFGAHPGDGADYGFWLSDMFQTEFDGVIITSDGFKDTITQQGNTLDRVPKGYTGELLEVNDHGNMTLYAVSRGRKRELWGIV